MLQILVDIGLLFPADFCSSLNIYQGCGAETIFFRSGSDFQKVSAPAPEPAPATALELPVFTDFMVKRIFFMFLIKKNRPNSHVRSLLFNMNLDFFKIL
jgi:hypothetical protein